MLINNWLRLYKQGFEEQDYLLNIKTIYSKISESVTYFL